MENISTIQLSLFLMTSLMMIPLRVIPLMSSLRTVFKRHDRKIGKKNPNDDQNPNPFLEHFPLLPF
jgi:hypothetical protein